MMIKSIQGIFFNYFIFFYARDFLINVILYLKHFILENREKAPKRKMIKAYKIKRHKYNKYPN